MKQKNCLNEQALILHFYGELEADNTQKQHLANCPLCLERLSSLSHDLSQLPSPKYESDDFSGTRMAAHVAERIRQPSRNRLITAIGVSATTAVIILMTFSVLPKQQVNQLSQVDHLPATNFEIEDSMPDIDFLEDLELLQELELLAQIEGV